MGGGKKWPEPGLGLGFVPMMERSSSCSRMTILYYMGRNIWYSDIYIIYGVLYRVL